MVFIWEDLNINCLLILKKSYVGFITKKITNVEAAKLLNMTRGTFLKYSKLYK